MDDYLCDVCRHGDAEPFGEGESLRWLCLDHHPGDAVVADFFRPVEWNWSESLYAARKAAREFSQP